jgi:SAM-dependent methyltransferase
LRDALRQQYYVYKLAEDLIRGHQVRCVLDIGSGPPVKLKHFIIPHCSDVVLADQPAVEKLARDILPQHPFVSVDLEASPIDLGRKFDLIICSDVIEHLRDPDPCLRLIKQHLASEGLVLLSTPERDVLRGTDCVRCEKPDHVREWNGAEFAAYLMNRGFVIVDHHFLPQTKLAFIEFEISRLLRGFRRRRWSACQVVVAKGADPNSSGGHRKNAPNGVEKSDE